MYNDVEKWIDALPLQLIPEEVEAFCFNLYDGCDNHKWAMELIGAASFDAEDEDWACDEVTDFSSRDAIFRWEKEQEWDAALDEMADALRTYLKDGKYAQILKIRAGVGVGFTDGNIEILYSK